MFKILKLVLLAIWQLPQNLIGVIMIPFIGKLTLLSSDGYNWCFKGTGMKGGISLGMFSFVSKNSATMPEVIAHEHKGHARQSLLLGPLYLFVIGIPSILHTFHRNCPCYYHFYTERWANNLAGLEVYTRQSTGKCALRFKD